MEKEKKNWWQLGEVELSVLEGAIFRCMLEAIVEKPRRTREELKELGTLKLTKRGSLAVEFDVSNEKRASMLFGTKWDKYEYRGAIFYKKTEERGK